MTGDDPRLRDRLLSLVPADGRPVGNGRLLELLMGAEGQKVTKAEYDRVRDQLLAEGRLVSGRGRGGSVRLAAPSAASDDLVLEAEPHPEPAPVSRPKAKTGKRGGAAKAESPNLIGYRHDERRVNNPEVGRFDATPIPTAGRSNGSTIPISTPRSSSTSPGPRSRTTSTRPWQPGTRARCGTRSSP